MNIVSCAISILSNFVFSIDYPHTLSKGYSLFWLRGKSLVLAISLIDVRYDTLLSQQVLFELLKI